MHDGNWKAYDDDVESSIRKGFQIWVTCSAISSHRSTFFPPLEIHPILASKTLVASLQTQQYRTFLQRQEFDQRFKTKIGRHFCISNFDDDYEIDSVVVAA